MGEYISVLELIPQSKHHPHPCELCSGIKRAIMSSAPCPLVDTLSIGPPQCASTPLIKRRPAAAPLPPVSLPTLDHAFPMVPQTFFQPAYIPAVCTSPYSSLPPYPMAYFPSPSYPISFSPPGVPLQRSVNPACAVFEYSRSNEMMTETRPLEGMIPSCPKEKTDIGKAVDMLMAQILASPTSPTPTPTRKIKVSLEQRLKRLESWFPTEVKELSSFLNFHSEAIEKEHQQCLKDGFFTADFHLWLGQRYTEQLHVIFERVDRQVQVLERQASTPKNRALDREAIGIMEKWYLEHLNNPYPTHDEAEDMANKGGITRGQVRKWFANKRHRTRKPRSAKAIALAEECEKIISVVQPDNWFMN